MQKKQPLLCFVVMWPKGTILPHLPPREQGSTADKGISVCSSQRGVRRTSHQARMKEGPSRASGSQRGWSGNSRPLLQKTRSGERKQVRPERAAPSVTDHFVNKEDKTHKASPNTDSNQTSQSLETHRNTNSQPLILCVNRLRLLCSDIYDSLLGHSVTLTTEKLLCAVDMWTVMISWLKIHNINTNLKNLESISVYVPCELMSRPFILT